MFNNFFHFFVMMFCADSHSEICFTLLFFAFNSPSNEAKRLFEKKNKCTIFEISVR